MYCQSVPTFAEQQRMRLFAPTATRIVSSESSVLPPIRELLSEPLQEAASLPLFDQDAPCNLRPLDVSRRHPDSSYARSDRAALIGIAQSISIGAAWNHDALEDYVERFTLDTKFVHREPFRGQNIHDVLRSSGTRAGTNRIPCDLCSATFSQKCHMLNHVRAVHQKIKKHKCSQCSSRFARRSYLREHLAVVHGKAKNRTCLQCGSKFGWTSELTAHLRIAHGLRADANLSPIERHAHKP